MKKIIVATLIVFVAGLSVSAQEDNSPVLRVYSNDLEKIYTVFFGDVIDREVTVTLEDKRGSKLITETISGKGFSKPYGLSSLALGDYMFTVKFDGEEYEFPITLKSEKEILAGNVTIVADYPTLKVNVTKYNMVPTNIMVFNMKDDLMKIFYWEPSESMMSREVDLSQFDGYEVRVHIEQNKETKLEQLVPLY
tara:strand:- start:29 stop:610 length:582 start_codon:yes stop_codon:yes gene_type:complete